MGQLETGLSLLDTALSLIETKSMRVTSALVWQLKGDLLLQTTQASPDERERQAEAYFERAIETARRQNAKMWELKAVMSLCRLWLAQGGADKRENARRRLAEIYRSSAMPT